MQLSDTDAFLLLQVRADRIQSDIEELIKALTERCKKHGFDVKSAAIIELPVGISLTLARDLYFYFFYLDSLRMCFQRFILIIPLPFKDLLYNFYLKESLGNVWYISFCILHHLWHNVIHYVFKVT